MPTAVKAGTALFSGAAMPVPMPRRRAARLACLLTLLSGAAAAAGAAELDGLSFHAFGTLGVARSGNSDADYVRDLSQPRGSSGNPSAKNDSILGVQANYRVNEQFEAVVQGVSHYRYDGSFSPELTWAFLKYSPTAELSLRAGRIGTEFFMLADSRMVGYSYLTVRPPVDFFGSLPFNYVDGVDGRYTRALDFGLLSFSAYGGVLREKVPAAGSVWNLGGSRMGGVSAELQQGPWQGRISYSRLRFDNDGAFDAVLSALGAASALGFPAAQTAADSLRLAGSVGAYQSVGAIYDDGDWQAGVAYNKTRRSSAVYEDSHSGYVLLGRHWGSLTPYAGYSWTYSTPKSLSTGLPDVVPDFFKLNTGIANFIRISHQDQHTLTLGGRWDFRQNLALKAQVDFVRGAPDSTFLVQQNSSAWNGRSSVLSVALDFFF